MKSQRKNCRCKSLNRTVIDELAAFNPKKVSYSYLVNNYGCSPSKTASPFRVNELMRSGAENGSALILIDARYDYEFRNCSIVGARNCKTRASLRRLLKKGLASNATFIFYCDSTMTRSKILSSALQRLLNADTEMQKAAKSVQWLVLDGGIESFIRHYPELCQGSFVPKTEKSFIRSGQMKMCSTNFRREFLFNNVSPKSGMIRAKSLSPNVIASRKQYFSTDLEKNVSC